MKARPLAVVVSAVTASLAAATLSSPAGAQEPPPKTLILGDSVGESLTPALEAVGAANGVEVVGAAIGGCGVLEGDPIDDEGNVYAIAANCSGVVARHQDEQIAAEQPGLVVWISSWESADRSFEGQRALLGTFTGNALITQLMDRTIARMTASGARVVIVTIPPKAIPSDHGIENAKNDVRLMKLAALQRSYVRAHPEIGLVDLAARLCPDGPPCPAVVDGVTPRPADGSHFEGPGAQWVADQIFPQLVTPPPPPETSPLTANASLLTT